MLYLGSMAVKTVWNCCAACQNNEIDVPQVTAFCYGINSKNAGCKEELGKSVQGKNLAVLWRDCKSTMHPCN
ncbi:hypothetical protein XENTR_v10000600 [Xenopus tropicalis]|nr:hypothetical protein XENTR_v10000600 [Xenopus tropicalis]